MDPVQQVQRSEIQKEKIFPIQNNRTIPSKHVNPHNADPGLAEQAAVQMSTVHRTAGLVQICSNGVFGSSGAQPLDASIGMRWGRFTWNTSFS